MESFTDLDFSFILLSLQPNLTITPILALILVLLSVIWFYPGGLAWALSRAKQSIPGPPGFVMAFSGTAPHRVLSELAKSLKATNLMAFSVGFSRFIISSSPDTAKEILNSSAFADRPIKESAYELLFHRAMGFAPFGEYWRNLRRISATHLFSPKRITAFGQHRGAIGVQMVKEIKEGMDTNGLVKIRKIVHFGSLNNTMMSVFGKRYDFGSEEGFELEWLVSEGYELLGAFNWSDHFTMFRWMDLQGVRKRCKRLVARVNVFVRNIIKEHRKRRVEGVMVDGEVGDFVDVLLDLEKNEKLSESDMISILWEMIFRGTDTVAILLEWIMARMVLHPEIQSKAQSEIDSVTGKSRIVSDSDIPNLPYLQAIVKECLRLHPPGPLLSWARLAIHDTHIGNDFIPAGTTAMVNMWAITHNDTIWTDANEFKPERFLDENVNILGSDLRLAPFGSGRRVCPGKALGLVTVQLWLAQMLQRFKWVPSDTGADLSECLKMSLEMKNSLVCKVLPREM